MPYTRSYRRYRGTARRTRLMGGIRKGFRGRRYRKRPVTAGAVKRIIDAELKFRDLGVGPVAIPTVTGFVASISGPIAQGDAVNQRNGNWIKPVTWYGTFTIVADAGAVVDTVQIRLMVVCWKENETNNPIDLSQIVQDTGSPHQGFNVQNKGQYSILWSRTGILSTNPDNNQFQKMYKFYVKPNMKILYDGAAEKNNQLFLIAYSDVATGMNPPTMEFETRLRYTDS